MKVISLLIITVIVILLFSTCDDRSPTKSKLDLSVTPMENEEAGLAAMWLSGELIAPVRFYKKIRDDLSLIRSTWQDSIPEVQIIYIPLMEPGKIALGFDNATYNSIKDSTYHDWDSLNSYYQLEGMGFFDFSEVVYLKFKGRLNPDILVDIYAGLPGGEYVHPNGRIGDYPLLLIYNARGKLKYFFRDAWGDCPAGCIYSTLNYFEIVNDSAIHRGSWYPDYPPNYDNAPVWYDTVQMARDRYYEYNSWLRES